MKAVSWLLVILLSMAMNCYAQGTVAQSASDKPVVSEPAPQDPVVVDPKSAVSAEKGNQKFLVVSEGGGGLNSFVIVDIEKKIAYTCNVYGNGGVKWEAADLEELNVDIEQGRAKRLGKKK